MLEAEIKAALSGLDRNDIKARAKTLGFIYSETLHETDIYFHGNDRDFHKTDEALRLRSCQKLSQSGNPESGSVTYITYKGPKFDNASSSRLEYETSVGSLNTMTNLLTALGYNTAFRIEKTREEFKLSVDALSTPDNPTTLTLCIDTVKNLGDYIELEIVAGTRENTTQLVDHLLEMLDRLEISRDSLTRKSYLELLYIK